MFAYTAINTSLLAGTTFAPGTPLVGDDIIFNGFGLQNDIILTDQPNNDDVGSIDFITYNKPRLDGGGILGHYYRKKDILIQGTIIRNNETELNTFLDYFKQQVNTDEGNLDIKVNGTYRRTEASLTGLTFGRKHYNKSWIPYNLQLRTVNPFFYEVITNTDTFADQTSSPIVGEIENTGSAVSFPDIIFTFAASGNSSVTSITYTANDTTITIGESISNSDILNIDCDNKEVLLNGTAVDYDGVFPNLEIGTNSFTITINGTFDVDILFTHKTNYI